MCISWADRSAVSSLAQMSEPLRLTCVGWAVGCEVAVRPSVALTVSRMPVGAFVGAVGGAVGCAVGEAVGWAVG